MKGALEYGPSGELYAAFSVPFGGLRTYRRTPAGVWQNGANLDSSGDSTTSGYDPTVRYDSAGVPWLSFIATGTAGATHVDLLRLTPGQLFRPRIFTGTSANGAQTVDFRFDASGQAHLVFTVRSSSLTGALHHAVLR